MRTGKVTALLLVSALLLAAIFPSCGGGESPKPLADTPSSTSPQVADGATLLQARCTRCHTLSRVERAQKTLDEWETTIQRMRGKGASLTDEEARTLAKYLAEMYGK